MKLFFLLFLSLAFANAATKYLQPNLVDSSGRVAGGNEANEFAHPFQVALIITFPNATETTFCGGSLVKRNWVLTAAHCANNGKEIASEFLVILGALNIDDASSTTLRIRSREVTIHPGFIPRSLLNDLALIKLPGDVEITDRIQTINLPPRSSVGDSFNGEEATLTGWGKTADNETGLAETLMEVKMSVITNTACNLRYQGEVQTTQMCTSGSEGKGACNGDDGGPLTLMVKGRRTQIGIYSYGFALGCQIGWPPVYIRTTSYLDWISTTAGISILP